MSAHVFTLTQPRTFRGFKSKVIKALKRGSLLEIRGEDANGEERKFKLFMTVIQPITGDYMVLGQDQNVEPCGWVSVNVDAESGKLIITVVG